MDIKWDAREHHDDCIGIKDTRDQNVVQHPFG